MTETKRRDFVGLRMAPTGLAAVDELAAELGCTRSQVLRLLLALGMERWRSATPGQRSIWELVHGLVDKSKD